MSASKTLTTYELDLLQLALIRLLFHVLSAFCDLLRLHGVCFPALRDLSDGACVEIREGLREVARRGFIRREVEVYCGILGSENGGEVELARSRWHGRRVPSDVDCGPQLSELVAT